MAKGQKGLEQEIMMEISEDYGRNDRFQAHSMKVGAIDFWKFMFTLMVIVFHSLLFWNVEMSPQIFNGGYIGVEFFFLVSGFLMAKSMQKSQQEKTPIGKDTARFVAHKVKGLYLPYVCGWAFSFVVTRMLTAQPRPGMLHHIVLSVYNLFMLEMAGGHALGHYLDAAWYISAMMMAILILYPLRRKFTDVFDWILAPILGIFLLNFSYQSCGNLCLVTNYTPSLFLYDGVVRAIAEIALGCFCFAVCEIFKKIKFRLPGRVLVSAVEIFGYIAVFICAYKTGYTALDFVLLLILGCSITLSFSQVGILSQLFHNKVCFFLGKFSLFLYFTHMTTITIASVVIMPRISALGNLKKLAIYFVFEFAIGLVFYFSVGLLAKILKWIGLKLKHAMIEEIEADYSNLS